MKSNLTQKSKFWVKKLKFWVNCVLTMPKLNQNLNFGPKPKSW